MTGGDRVGQYTAKAEIGGMTKSCLATGNITVDIAVARDGYAIAYLIKGDEEYIAIDAGERKNNALCKYKRIRPVL
mgnify:CR=1 FL=1